MSDEKIVCVRGSHEEVQAEITRLRESGYEGIIQVATLFTEGDNSPEAMREWWENWEKIMRENDGKLPDKMWKGDE